MTMSIAYRNKQALVIGINRYQRNPLNFCVNDAKDLTTTLQHIGFNVVCKLNCNSSEFFDSINTFSRRIQCDDLALVYFAGHGKQSRDENYLFPSDYEYDHRESEHDYIINHAISVKHIMKKIDDQKHRVAIYLFDCCRNFVRTRAPDTREGLLAMNPTAHSLIVYACAPGKEVQDETRNDRNGCFMQHLLQYIIVPNTDIETIMKEVAYYVELETGGFQLPHRASSLTSKVFLVRDDNHDRARSDTHIRHDTLLLTHRSNQPPVDSIGAQSNLLLREADTDLIRRPLKNAPPKKRFISTPHEHQTSTHNNVAISPATSRTIAPMFTERPKFPSQQYNDEIKLPANNTGQNTPGPERRGAIGTSSMAKVEGSTCRYSENRRQIVKKPSNGELPTYSIDMTVAKTSVKNREQLLQIARSTIGTNSSIYTKYFQDDDEEEGNASNAAVQLTDRRPVATPKAGKPTFLKTTVKHADCQKSDDPSIKLPTNVIDQSNNEQQPSSSMPTATAPSTTIDRTKSANHSKYTARNSQQCGDLTVFVQSLQERYELHIPVNSTIKQLKNTIWQKININVERCQEQSHLLLLFTHRMHIFLNEEAELVSEFLKLTPSEPHFYFYAIRRHQQSDEMYTYETKIANTFAEDTNWWTPVYFMEDVQLPRPQSVLLSSLYALRLFFYKSNDELSMWRQAMEAQFFVHLRKYLFPPGVLALKHAMEGALFWFEKPLIVDSLLQLLAVLCPGKIKRNELCDCIPLLFCWILEQCDPTTTDSDFYQLVTLVYWKGNEKHYFSDPATLAKANSVPLVMHERETIHIDAIRHVDFRSFTRYMQNKSNYANISSCQCEEYLIYDPPKGTAVPIASISRLTDEQIKQLYETMARKYQSFTLITRGALRTDVNDQLVLMQDRTVALVFTRKMNRRPKTASSTAAETVDYIFEIFNPLQHTVGKRQYVGSDQLYQWNKNSAHDPCLPEHFLLNACETSHIGSVNDPSVKAPTQQITIVVLDISRSMFEKSASPDPNDPKSVLDMSIIMLGTMCDNIVFGRCAHDVGLIHFGVSNEVICPISRDRNDFEKALTIQPQPQEWTSMYDALNRAITLIGTHIQKNKNSIAHDCKKLIICISDGIDNHSSTTLDQLGDRLKNYDIVVDFISFLRDDLLKDREKDRVSLFRQLCKKTHGYVYCNLPVTNIELGATFEQEAAIWLGERDTKSFGLVDKPVRRMPAQLHLKATNKVPAQLAQTSQNASNCKRVLSEVNNVIKAQMNNINVYVCRNDILFWKIILNGPLGTPYEGGRWMLYVHFGPQYPRQPPSIRFVTEIYHVNVNADGRVCHHLFDRGWANNTTMIEVFQNILQLLQEPNFDDAVSTEKAQLKRDQPKEYDRQVNEWTQRHGSKSLDQLKVDFELED